MNSSRKTKKFIYRYTLSMLLLAVSIFYQDQTASAQFTYRNSRVVDNQESYAEEVSKDNFFTNFSDVLAKRWPVFKERAAMFCEYSKAAAAQALVVSKLHFNKNLNQLISNTLFLNKFEIEGNSLVSNEQALAADNFISGKWLWDISLNQTEKNIKQLAWVKSANVNVGVFPIRMKVKIEEHNPWMLAEFSKRLWIVSEQGSLLSPVAEVKNIETLRSLRSLPRLVGLSDNSDWEDQTYLRSENARYHHATKSLKFLREAGGLPYRAGLIELLHDGAIQITAAQKSSQHPKVIMQVSSLEEAKTKIAILDKVIKDLEKRNELAKKVDLRFEDRAIVN